MIAVVVVAAVAVAVHTAVVAAADAVVGRCKWNEIARLTF